jgi:hypothetical protein
MLTFTVSKQEQRSRSHLKKKRKTMEKDTTNSTTTYGQSESNASDGQTFAPRETRGRRQLPSLDDPDDGFTTSFE